MFAAFKSFISKAASGIDELLSVIFGEGHAAILYTLKEGVETVSVEHKTALASATTTDVSLSVSAVSVTPGGLASIFITGAVDSNAHPLPVVAIPYGGLDAENDNTQWWASTTYGGTGWTVSWMGQDSAWQARYDDGAGNTASFYTGTATGKLPTDPSLTWMVDQSGSGTPTVSGGSSASQVLAALTGTDADDLITYALAPGSNGFGAVSVAGPTTLYR